MNNDSVKTEKDAVDDGEKKKGKRCWWKVKTGEKAVEVLMTGKKGECCWWRGSRRSHGGWLIVESLMGESLRLRERD